ncbi:unnamed protein product [Sphagnum jensenii]|uniref:Haloacid dehalogenase-like hydrolase n=1 Tax=Sphagnum jensenii TaxID=128206 RepID=A0ABP1BF84_9BRYO
MMGKKSLEARKIFEETSLDGILSPEDFIKRREMMLHGMFPDSDLVPGAERLISHLHAHNVPMAVATRQQHDSNFALMCHIVVGDDPAVVHGKPLPDVFLIAAQGFQDPELKMANVLVFKDAP